MKTRIFLVMMMAIAIISCQKEKNDTVIQMEQQFSGNICVNPADYEGSAYDNQSGSLKAEMQAIITVKVFNNGVAIENSPFKNINFYDSGAPLTVQYPDNLGKTGEVFTFEIWVWVKATTGYTYQLYHTFAVTDDQMIDTGTDGVVDFAIGSCWPDAKYQWTWQDPPPPVFDLIIHP
jgi:hypothetical protein